jgi:hypothetical protein
MIVECNSIKIETYGLRASVYNWVWRRDMAFEFGEIMIRMMVTDPCSIVSLAKEWFEFHARKGYKPILCLRMEQPLPRWMSVSECFWHQ